MSAAVATTHKSIAAGDDEGWIEVKHRSADGPARQRGGDRAPRRTAEGGERPPRREAGGERRRRDGEGNGRQGGRRGEGKKSETAAETSSVPAEEVVVAGEPEAKVGAELEGKSEMGTSEPSAAAPAPVRIPLRNVLPGGRSWAKVVAPLHGASNAFKEPELVAPVIAVPKSDSPSHAEMKAKQPEVKVQKTEAAVTSEKPAPVAAASSSAAAPTSAAAWANFRKGGPVAAAKVETAEKVTPLKEMTTPVPVVEIKVSDKQEVAEEKSFKAVDAAVAVEESPAPMPTKEPVAEVEEPVTPATAVTEPESSSVVEPTVNAYKAGPVYPTEEQLPMQPEMWAQQRQMPHHMMAPMPVDPYGYSAQEANVTMPPYAFMDISVQARIFEEDYYKQNPRQRCRGWKPHLTYFYPNAYAPNPYLVRWHDTQGQQLPAEEEQELQRVLTQPMFVYIPPYFPQHGPMLPPQPSAPGAPGNIQQSRRPPRQQQPVPPMNRNGPHRNYYAPSPHQYNMAHHHHLQQQQQQQPRQTQQQHYPTAPM